jgi:hypothetical protein
MLGRCAPTGRRPRNVRKTSKPTSGSRKRSPKSGRLGPPSGAALVLAALAEVARKRAVRWYLFGAQAVAVYGVARTSADVDVTVDLAAAQARSFVADMRRAGFALRVPDVDGFVASTRVLPFTHRDSGFPLDVVLAGPGIEQAFLEEVRLMSFEGIQVPVLSPADLIVTKILAGRPRDLEDVRGVLRQPNVRLDLTRARSLLQSLEQALGQSDLVSLLDSLIHRSPARRKR